MSISNNEKFYKESIKDYGISPQGVHWNSKYSQYKRFEIITKLIRKKISTSSIADIGCGFADYYTYLLDNNYSQIDYLGIDCEKTMIDICNTKYKNQNFLILNAIKDDLPTKDYYICSGALNILGKKEVFEFIKNCFEASRKAFIFNFLKKDSFNNIKKEEILEFCEMLDPAFRCVENYLYNDCTIIIKKLN